MDGRMAVHPTSGTRPRDSVFVEQGVLSYEPGCIACKAEEHREDLCSRITFKEVQCIYCNVTMLRNNICPHHEQTRAIKPIARAVCSGYACWCARFLKRLSKHISLLTNAILVRKRKKKRISFSGGPIFSYLIWLTTFFMVICGCATAPTKGCPGPDYIIHENGFCCGVVSCERNFTVSMCQIQYGNDTCVRCPEGSFLLDRTTSETATSCIKPNCMKNMTRPSLVKSTTINHHACPQWCTCDVSFKFCGTDPCNCRKVICPFREVLQQDCGCRPTTPSPPKATPSKAIPVTLRNFTTSQPEVSVTTATTRSNTLTVDNTTTPGTVTPFSSGTNNSDNNTKTLGLGIGIPLTLFAVIAIIIVVVCWRKRKKHTGTKERKKHTGTKVKTTESDRVQPANVTNNIYNIKIKKVDNMQMALDSAAATNFEQDIDDSLEDEVPEDKSETQPFIQKDNVIKTEAVIEGRTDHAEEDINMDGPPSSLPATSSNIQDNVTDDETEVKRLKSDDTIVTDEATKVKRLISDDKIVTDEATKVKRLISDDTIVTDEATKVKRLISDNKIVTDDKTKVKRLISDDTIVTDDETKVKKVKPDDIIELKPLPNKCVPLVEKEDTRLGEKETASGNQSDSRPPHSRKQNGTVPKESRNGHAKNYIKQPFEGFVPPKVSVFSKHSF